MSDATPEATSAETTEAENTQANEPAASTDATEVPETVEGLKALLDSVNSELASTKEKLSQWTKYSRGWEDKYNELKHEKEVSSVLKKAGLPDTAAAYITGKTEEEMLTQAENFKSAAAGLFAPSKTENTEVTPAAPAPVKVTPNPLQGVASAGPADPAAKVQAEVASLFRKK